MERRLNIILSSLILGTIVWFAMNDIAAKQQIKLSKYQIFCRENPELSFVATIVATIIVLYFIDCMYRKLR